MDLTNQRHEAELQSLKSLLQKEANSAADDQAKLEREKQALQSALHKEKTERSAEVAQLKSTQAAEIKSLDDSRKQVKASVMIIFVPCIVVQLFLLQANKLLFFLHTFRSWIAQRRSCVRQLTLKKRRW